MPIDTKTSSRIEILRFPFIIGVVFIHNYGTTISLAQGSLGVTHTNVWVDFITFFISRGVAQVAVPLFFAISGYLFFLGGWSWGKHVNKLKRRLHTLLIPFLFWNLLTLAIFAVVQSIPQTKTYFAGTVWAPVRSFSFFDYMNALFGITVKYPIAFQFWFIRDLMVCVLLAPVIHFLLFRKTALPFILSLFCLWFFAVWPVLWPSVDAAFFFCLGAYLAWPGKSVEYLDRFGPQMSAIFLSLLVFNAAFPDRLQYLQRAAIVFGVTSLWWLTALAIKMPALNALLKHLSGASFFVFAAHEPLLIVARKLSYKLLMPSTGATILALYFLIPLCLIAVLVLIHHCLLKIAPSFVGFISGTSGLSERQRA